MSTVEARAFTAPGAVSSRYPWLLVGLLWMVAFLNAADRSIIIAVMPQLREEFGLTPTQLALLSSVFFWIYAFAAFLSGQLGDSVRRSRVIIYGLVFWSLATGVVSLSTGFAMLLALRGVVALGEATYYPTATALISDWHRPQFRSRALSLHQTGVFAGAGLGALFSGMMADQMGWRTPFVVFGVAGLVVGAVLLKWLRDAPPRRVATQASTAAMRTSPGAAQASTGMTAAPTGTVGPSAGTAQVSTGATQASAGPAHASDMKRAAAEAAPTAAGTAAGLSPLRIVLGRPPALALCAVFFLGTGASTGVTVWAPTYVHDALGLNLADSALYGSATINIAGFLSVPLGGLLADWLAARTPIGRFYTLAIGLAAAAVLLLPLALAATPLAVGMVLLASSVGKGLFDGCIYASMHDVVPSEARATAVGLMTMVGFIGAGLTPIFVAQAAQLFGMVAGLTSLTVLYFVAVALLLAMRGVTRRVVLETRALEEKRGVV
jgi:MFS family permease